MQTLLPHPNLTCFGHLQAPTVKILKLCYLNIFDKKSASVSQYYDGKKQRYYNTTASFCHILLDMLLVIHAEI